MQHFATCWILGRFSPQPLGPTTTMKILSFVRMTLFKFQGLAKCNRLDLKAMQSKLTSLSDIKKAWRNRDISWVLSYSLEQRIWSLIEGLQYWNRNAMGVSAHFYHQTLSLLYPHQFCLLQLGLPFWFFKLMLMIAFCKAQNKKMIYISSK